MGPVHPVVIRPAADRAGPTRWLPLRRRVPRSRVPLHRRIRQDPAAVRRWLVVLALAWLLASIVGTARDQADAARARWGRAAAVWVVDRPVRAGEPLGGAVRRTRWPAALVPHAVVAHIPTGARSAGPLDEGTPVTAAVIADDGPRRQTVAVPVGEARLPVEAGDRVDVWATSDPATTADGDALTRRVAVDARVASSSDRAVVLEVAPAQVDAVATAAATATVALVGR